MDTPCLTIAGFDGSGGAGLQADLKTFSALGSYGMTVLTAIAVQNTCGVRACYNIPLESIEQQLKCIWEDIPPKSIKIGMLFSQDVIELVANFLKTNAKNIPIVLDPVMIAKGGAALLQESAMDSLINKLLPICSIVTPNLMEAKHFIKTDNMEEMGKHILSLGPQCVLVKGGHLDTEHSNDLFINDTGVTKWIESKRIKTRNTHGTGCTLSSAICTFLSQGYEMLDACIHAKAYVHNAIKAAVMNSVGHGHGPVDHFHNIWNKLCPPDISNILS